MNNDKHKYLKYKKKYLKNKNNKYYQTAGSLLYFPLNDEIHFWGRQIMEHAFFLYLGLEETELKKRAFNLWTLWKSFLDENFYKKGIVINIKTIELTDNDLKKVSKIDIANLLKYYIEPMVEFNTRVVENLSSGKWIGWIYISLANHMLSEIQYFHKKIIGKSMTINEEVEYINEHNSGEIGVTAQLIDPSPQQQQTIDLARSYATRSMSKYKAGHVLSLDGPSNSTEKFPFMWTKEDEEFLKGMNTTEQKKMIDISIRYSDELTKFAEDTNEKIESNELKSVINPVLGWHVYREFFRFTLTLKRIVKKNS